MEEIVNKVAQSGLITLDLKSYLPSEAAVVTFDIKPFLFRELLLREKDFREQMKTFDWTIFQDKYVAVICSSDAIIPMWAYMLIGSYLEGMAKGFTFATVANYRQQILLQHIAEINAANYQDKRVIIKGCGDEAIPEAAFLAITKKLQPVVKTLMYGEPCSTVPIYKRK
jgi:hypothetical protein